MKKRRLFLIVLCLLVMSACTPAQQETSLPTIPETTAPSAPPETIPAVTVPAVTVPEARPEITSIFANISAIEFHWTAVEGADGYSIYRKVGTNGTFTYLKMVSGVTEYLDESVNPGTPYYYKVCPFYYNEDGSRRFSNFGEPSQEATVPTEYHLLTLIDDDGKVSFYEKLLPIIREYQIPISAAIVTDHADRPGFLSWEQIAECHQAGAEILNHTKEHYTSLDQVKDLPKEEIRQSYLTAQKIFEEHGYTTGNILVYSGATAGVTWSVAQEVFRCGINSSGNTINTLPFRLFTLRRYKIGSDHTPDFAELKSYIDEIANTNGWQIWMMHSGNGYMNEAYIKALKQAIEYTETAGVKIVTAEEALDFFRVP